MAEGTLASVSTQQLLSADMYAQGDHPQRDASTQAHTCALHVNARARRMLA
jgi:hypothetical protein